MTNYLLFLLFFGVAALKAANTPAVALLVLEKDQNTLLIVDPVTQTIAGRVPVGMEPHEVVLSEDGKTAYISNFEKAPHPGRGATISVVDLIAQKPLPAIDLGALRAPHGLVSAGGKLYFTAEGSKAIGRYDLATHKVDWVLGTGQDHTHMIMLSKDGKTIFTTNGDSATVSFIAEAPVVKEFGPGRGRGGPPRIDWAVNNVAAGHGAEGFDLSPDGKEVWVANGDDQTISIIAIASRKVLQTIPATKMPNRLKFTHDGKYVLVSDLLGDQLLVLDATSRKEFKKIELGTHSEGILMAPDGAHAYVSLNVRGSVAIIDLKTMAMTGEIKTGLHPDGLAWAVRK